MKNKQGILFILLIMGFSFLVKAGVVYEENLQGKNIQIGNLLKWSTSNEEENKVFHIERSEDGISFGKIGEVKGAGDSFQTKDYQFLDINVHGEKYFYRLQQIDFDGTSSFSEVLHVHPKHANNFMLTKMQGVITNSVFEAIFDVYKDGILYYSLSDLEDQIIYENLMTVFEGMNKINVDMEFHPVGNYKLTFEMDGEVENIIIQRIEGGNDNVAKKN